MGIVTSTKRRERYHHGDLANALAAAALDRARERGPEAVVLREVARSVGVSATAAYRHFSGHDDLLDAVREQCQRELADRMLAVVAAQPPDADPGREALRQLRGLGEGYIRFAIEEPGLFRTAFCRGDGQEPKQWDSLLTAPSFLQLAMTLDHLVGTGVLAAANRDRAEIVAWASVHGLALLLLDGPVGTLPPTEREATIGKVLDATIIAVLGHAA